MAIQTRRGNFTDFNPAKMLPGEPACVLAGDPSVPSGKAFYVCYSAGDVKRLVSIEDIEAMIQRGDFGGGSGKTAYQYAKDFGYTGTEAAFYSGLAKIDKIRTDIDDIKKTLKDIQEKLNTTPSVDSLTVNEINDMIVEYFENKTVSEVEA